MAVEASLGPAGIVPPRSYRHPGRPLRRQPDARLLADAAGGSERAFEALVERHGGSLLRHCARVLPDARAEDALQQGLLQAWLALEQGTEVRDPRGWLHRIVHNAALDILRKPAYLHVELDESLPTGEEPDRILERRRRVREILAGIAELPEIQREALMRTAVAGESHERVASSLGVSVGAVRGLVYRARASLRTAVMALTPAPLMGWAAAALRRGAAVAERLDGAADSAGAMGTVLKGSLATVAVGALAAGTAAVGPTLKGVHPQQSRRAGAQATHRAAPLAHAGDPAARASGALASGAARARVEGRAPHDALIGPRTGDRRTHGGERVGAPSLGVDRHDRSGTSGPVAPSLGGGPGSSGDGSLRAGPGTDLSGSSRAGSGDGGTGGGGGVASSGGGSSDSGGGSAGTSGPGPSGSDGGAQTATDGGHGGGGTVTSASGGSSSSGSGGGGDWVAQLSGSGS